MIDTALRRIRERASWFAVTALLAIGQYVHWPSELRIAQTVTGLALLWVLGWLIASCTPEKWDLPMVPKALLAGPLAISVLGVITYLIPYSPAFIPGETIGLAFVLTLILLVATPNVVGCKEWMNQSGIVVLFGLLPIIFFIIRGLANPYLADMDGHSYVRLLEQVVAVQRDSSFLFPRRAAFSHLVVNLYYLTGFSFEALFKWVLPASLWLAIGSVVSFVVSRTKRFLPASLLILLSPAFLNAADRYKPETSTWVVALPVMLCAFISVEKRDWRAYLVGLVLSGMTLRLHDTGTVLLLAYVLFGLVLIAIDWQHVRPHITGRSLGLALVVMLPYLIIFNVTGIVQFLRGTFSLFTSDIAWHPTWWFLNSYHSGGAQLGWPGWKFLLYYAYNGGPVVLLALGIMIVGLVRKGRLYFTLLTAPAILFTIYLALAEVLPRFGVFILPDRSMIHAFFFGALLVTLALPVLQVPDTKLRWVPVVNWAITVYLTISVVGTTYLARYEGGLVSYSEKGAIHAIQALPADAIIISPQVYNDELVETYGQKLFVTVTAPLADSAAIVPVFRQLSEALTVTPIRLTEVVNRETVEEVTVTNENGWQLSTTKHVVATTSEEHPVDADVSIRLADRPLYLLYSFAKTDGWLSKVSRSYWQVGTDAADRNIFAAATGPEVVYRDASTVLIKIR